jgi:hopene-associated glycosyltransferase HpnB
MATVLSLLTLATALFWFAVTVAPARPASTRERLDAGAAEAASGLSRVTALVPARNEELTIGKTLSSLRRQAPELEIIVVDDQSNDDTANIVMSHPERARLIAGTATPPDWLGKVWALEQGLEQVKTPLVLLVDADIELAPGILPTLLAKLEDEELGLVSLMARLRTASAWERLLVPAYIYFFKLLYPFNLVNAPDTKFAAAAGGCILVRKTALHRIGGFAAIRGAIIDDCALATAIKRAGYPIWLGLTDSVRSIRAYDRLADLWHLVARSAFAELRFSVPRLLLCTLAMLILFWVPVATVILNIGGTRYIGIAALLLMIGSYVPILRFYQLNSVRALTLPLVAVAYLAMTWTSALRYLLGQPTIWKTRKYRNIGEYK